jgi:hypothetical protein
MVDSSCFTSGTHCVTRVKILVLNEERIYWSRVLLQLWGTLRRPQENKNITDRVEKSSLTTDHQWPNITSYCNWKLSFMYINWTKMWLWRVPIVLLVLKFWSWMKKGYTGVEYYFSCIRLLVRSQWPWPLYRCIFCPSIYGYWLPHWYLQAECF